MEPHKSTQRTRTHEKKQSPISKFAVVDVETTGGHSSKHRITEIGIVLIDDFEIVDTYETFVNPHISIPRHITSLTGITNEDVEDAPDFSDLASEIQRLLEDRVFVAQNVNFDYSFIKSEFERVGQKFSAKRLCTSRYARSRINGLRKSSLKVLAEHFQVINENPHRALSDALTAAKILLRLLEIDDDFEIAYKLINKKETKVTLPNHTHPDDYKSLPSKPGVYFFKGEDGKPIYIGKAKNIKQRVSSHFNGDLSSRRTQAFLREIYAIDYLETGTDLMAYLVEDTLIRKHWPIHNRAQKHRVKKFGVISYKDQNGNYRLAVNPIRMNESALKVFYYYSAAMQWLHEKTVEMQLNPNYVGLVSLAKEIEVSDQEHNQRVERLMLEMSKPTEVKYLKLTGSEKGEWCYLAIAGQRAKGYKMIKHIDNVVLDEMELLTPSATSEKILENYLQKNSHQLYSYEEIIQN